jgi:CRP-like cAMP-binding protein
MSKQQTTILEKVFLLRETPAFSTLDLDTLLAIADKVDTALYEAGEFIFEVGGNGHNSYILIDGCITLAQEEQSPVSRPTIELKPTTLFGEEGAFSDSTRRYTAISHTATQLLVIYRSTILNAIAECPQLAINILSDYANRTPRVLHTSQNTCQETLS